MSKTKKEMTHEDQQQQTSWQLKRGVKFFVVFILTSIITWFTCVAIDIGIVKKFNKGQAISGTQAVIVALLGTLILFILAKTDKEWLMVEQKVLVTTKKET